MWRKALMTLAVLGWLIALVGSAQADGTPTPQSPGARLDANGASVTITFPKNGDVLSVPTVVVRVETTNWPLGEAGHQFRLYVNGQDQGVSQSDSPAMPARDLRPGDNTLEVVLVNEQHQELNATDKINVRYDASGSAPSAPAPLSAAPSLPSNVVIGMLGLAVAAVVALGIGFVLQRKKSG